MSPRSFFLSTFSTVALRVTIIAVAIAAPRVEGCIFVNDQYSARVAESCSILFPALARYAVYTILAHL